MLTCMGLIEGMTSSRLWFFFSSRRRHTRWNCDWSSDVCSSDLDVRGHGALVDDEVRLAHQRIAVLHVAREFRQRVHHPELGERELHGTVLPRRGEALRSEERRVGKECRARGCPYHQKKKKDVTR